MEERGDRGDSRGGSAEEVGEGRRQPGPWCPPLGRNVAARPLPYSKCTEWIHRTRGLAGCHPQSRCVHLSTPVIFIMSPNRK